MADKLRDCKVDELWNGTEKVCIPRNDREMVGDNQLPNKYWVTLQNGELICEDGSCDWNEEIESKGGTVAVFDTFKEALRFVEGFEDGHRFTLHGETFNVTNKTIEDRLGGEVFSRGLYKYREISESYESHVQTQYTRNEMQKRGENFV